MPAAGHDLCAIYAEDAGMLLAELDRIFIKAFILIAMVAFVGEAIAANL